MFPLPNECLIKVLEFLLNDYRSYGNLFSCLLVNRQWCRIIIPILWSKPLLKNVETIRILLLGLNTEEQALLIPFKIKFPNNAKTLFKYSSYIKKFYDYDLTIGVKNWLRQEGFKYTVGVKNWPI